MVASTPTYAHFRSYLRDFRRCYSLRRPNCLTDLDWFSTTNATLSKGACSASDSDIARLLDYILAAVLILFALGCDKGYNHISLMKILLIMTVYAVFPA